MWKYLIILFVANSEAFRMQLTGTNWCNDGSTCIPLSECPTVKDMLQVIGLLDRARSSFCGYFHEPYVCCDKNCNTPNGNYGQSLPLDTCPHLKANEQSPDPKRRKFLSESYLNKTHVCCNEGEDIYQQVPPAPIGAFNHAIPKPLTSSCVTPNGEIAKCVHINDCDSYQEVATETDVNFRFINDSFCGLWKNPMVCCGEVSQYKENYKINLPDDENCGVWDEKVVNSTIPPWLVLIQSPLKTCIGAVINQEYVLATANCAGDNYKKLNLKLGGCINNERNKDCKFEVENLKTFPLYQYLTSEDIGMVLLKLNRPIATEDYMPVCLPNDELADYQEIDIIGLEKNGLSWKGTTIVTKTKVNDWCHNAMRMYVERIVCIEDNNFCNTKKPLLQNFVLFNENQKWYLGGLFNKEGCYGPNDKYFNAIYVYKFLPWIYSNLN